MSRNGRYLFTSESVTEGHPDKIADQISDSVLDAILAQDPMARVACETLVTTGLAVIAGEITTNCTFDFQKVVRETIKDVGYTRGKYGFDAETCAVLSSIHGQSPDIAMGVDPGGAGDQGLMFGYACTETEELMPLPIMLAHKLVKGLSTARRSGVLDYLRPDGKSQVSVEYDNGKPVRVDTVVVSTQHSAEVENETLKKDITEKIVEQVIPANMMDKKTRILINPTGRFVVGGPHGDAGVTGRKIIVDTYGGAAPHGGGAFSGKDPTKVDRSACYMARYVAKNVVAAGLAEQCMVQLAYAIGVAEPVSVLIDTSGTGKLPDDKLSEIVRANFKLTPKGIIETLDLRRPIYRKTAAFGHFGRTEPEFTWERTDKADALRADAKVVTDERLDQRSHAQARIDDGGPRGRRFLLDRDHAAAVAGEDRRGSRSRAAGSHGGRRLSRSQHALRRRRDRRRDRRRAPPAPGFASSSSPITATQRGLPPRQPTMPACSSSTPSRSARTAATTSRWDWARRHTRSVGKRRPSSKMCGAWAASESSRTPTHPGRSCAGATGRRRSTASSGSTSTASGATSPGRDSPAPRSATCSGRDPRWLRCSTVRRTLDRWDALSVPRALVGVPGHDAHGGTREGERATGLRSLLRVPSYEASFRAFSLRAILERELTGDAAADARLVLAAVRSGQVFSVGRRDRAGPHSWTSTGASGQSV